FGRLKVSGQSATQPANTAASLRYSNKNGSWPSGVTRPPLSHSTCTRPAKVSAVADRSSAEVVHPRACESFGHFPGDERLQRVAILLLRRGGDSSENLERPRQSGKVRVSRSLPTLDPVRSRKRNAGTHAYFAGDDKMPD